MGHSKKRLVLFVAAAAVVLAGCGGGNDTLANVVGPNPISDAHSVVSQINDRGWSDARKAAFAQQFVDKYQVTPAQAACMAGYFSSAYTYAEVIDPNNYPTASETAKSTAALQQCMAS